MPCVLVPERAADPSDGGEVTAPGQGSVLARPVRNRPRASPNFFAVHGVGEDPTPEAEQDGVAKIPAGSDVLSTIIVLQRGQAVVKIVSACRGCPLGTVPADAAAFATAQVAQAEANGLPKA